MGDGARVVAYVPDLMDRSRIAASVPGVLFVSRPAELSTREADIVLVDLARAGALDAVKGLSCRVVGFGPHVDRDALAQGEAAGIEAMPRSEFFRRLSDILGSLSDRLPSSCRRSDGARPESEEDQ